MDTSQKTQFSSNSFRAVRRLPAPTAKICEYVPRRLPKIPVVKVIRSVTAGPAKNK